MSVCGCVCCENLKETFLWFTYSASHSLQSTTDEEEGVKRGVVVGCYDTSDGYQLSGCGLGVDGECSGHLSQLISRSVSVL